MLRHLFLTLEYPPAKGGVGRYTAGVAEHLPRGTVTVLAPPHHGDAECDRASPVAVLRRPLLFARMWPQWLPLIHTVQRMVRRGDIDIVHVGHVLPIGTAVWIALWRNKVPYLVYTHGMDLLLPRTSPVKRWLVRRILRSAVRVVTNTRFTKGLAEWYGVPQDRIIVLPPACSIRTDVDESEAAQYGAVLGLEGKQIVLSVGRLVTRKGFDTLVAALGVIRERLPNLHVVIVGDGPDRIRLASLIEQNTLQNRVHLLGTVTDGQLQSLYRLCDAFAMVSRAEGSGSDVEGFGMVYTEANAFGKPVIAGRTGGVEEAVVDGVTGLVVDPHSVEQTAQAMAALCSDQAFAQKLGEAGRLRAEQEFTWEATMKPFLAWLASFERVREVRQ